MVGEEKNSQTLTHVHFLVKIFLNILWAFFWFDQIYLGFFSFLQFFAGVLKTLSLPMNASNNPVIKKAQ